MFFVSACRADGLELQSQRIRLGDNIVDFQQLTIERHGEIWQLQSKMMQVLACLLATPGQLVTIEQLMEQVWGQTIVSPNTLQRCIAQLRKAFGDSPQQQLIIKTYPRRGYALLVQPQVYLEQVDNLDVERKQPLTAHSSAAKIYQTASPAIPNRVKTATTRYARVLQLSMAALLMMGALGVTWRELAPTDPITATQSSLQLTPQSRLTATSAYEQLPVFSGDGQYLAFSRFDTWCEGHLWLQQLATKTEWQLSQQAQRFASIAFAPEQMQLAAISAAACTAPQHPPCWQLSLFQLDNLTKPTQQTLGVCEHRELSQLYWQTAQHLVLLGRSATTGLRALLRFQRATNQLIPLFQQGDVLTYQVLPQGEIALIAHQGNANSELLHLSADGHIKQRALIQFPATTSAFNPLQLSYQADTHQLLLLSEGQLFALSWQGQLRWLAQTRVRDVQQLALHPKLPTAVASVGGSDFDLFNIDFTNWRQSPVAPSKASEWQAKLAAHSTTARPKLAFASNRSGQAEIWLQEKHQQRQLSRLPANSQIKGLLWQADGQGLWLHLNDELWQLSLQGELKRQPLPMRLKYLHQLTPQGQLLLEYQHDYAEMLALYDVKQQQLKAIHAGQFDDARIDHTGTLWFIDHHFKLFRLGLNTIQPTSTAQQQGGALQRQLEKPTPEPMLPDLSFSALSLHQNELRLSSKDDQLHQYQLPEFITISSPRALPKGSWLQDANENQAIFGMKTERHTDLIELGITQK